MLLTVCPPAFRWFSSALLRSRLDPRRRCRRFCVYMLFPSRIKFENPHLLQQRSVRRNTITIKSSYTAYAALFIMFSIWLLYPKGASVPDGDAAGKGRSHLNYCGCRCGCGCGLSRRCASGSPLRASFPPAAARAACLPQASACVLTDTRAVLSC